MEFKHQQFDPTKFLIKSTAQVQAEIASRHPGVKAEDIQLRGMGVEYSFDDLTDHQFRVKITSDVMDRENEVLLPSGLDATDFKKTGTWFYNHSYDWPVAKNLEITQHDDCWRCKGEFPNRPEYIQNDFFPDYVRCLVQQGIIRNASVGFLASERRAPTKKDIEKYGPNVKTIYSKYKLLEVSFAPLAANADALVEAVGKSLIPASIAKLILPDIKLPVIVEAASKDPVVPDLVQPLVVQWGDMSPPKRLKPEEVRSLMEETFRRSLAKARGVIFHDG